MNPVKLLIPLICLLIPSAAAPQSKFTSRLPLKSKKGYTVAGIVECEEQPVAGVIVSDGYEVTTTDKNGAYYLKSCKRNPQVFITAPGNYEIWRDDVVPQFWADFELPSDRFERHDFRLKKANNLRHAIIIFADAHLANQRNDVKIFSTDYADVLKARSDSLEKDGYKVYTFNLGDSSWDTYWASNGYLVSDFRDTLNDIGYPTAVYSCMGNHDNDPGAEFGNDTDFIASLPYQKAFGPRYYSQNIGKVHYVFLDNINYINTPSDKEIYKGLYNKRNYTEEFSEEQLEWLKKDLSKVSHDTPIVVAMHGPMFRWIEDAPKKGATRISDEVVIRTDSASTMQLLEILRPYKNAHAFSGHSHKQSLVRIPEHIGTLVEHNISGVCGAWWHTRATGLKNLCPDGTPVAYETLMVDIDSITWAHHTFEFPDDRMFFAWDMNGVKEYFSQNEEIKVLRNLFPKWKDYSHLPENTIYINIWNYDPQGELIVEEDGLPLQVEKITDQNPLLTAAYVCRNVVWRNEWDKPGYAYPQMFNLFKVQAHTPDSRVRIVWKDSFGRTFQQLLQRPAVFTLPDVND